LQQDLARLKAALADETARLAAAERAKQEAALMAEMEGGSSGGGGGGGGSSGGGGGEGGDADEDALDAFMSGVETQMDKDQVGGGVVWVITVCVCLLTRCLY
jgi:hypothetical protein